MVYQGVGTATTLIAYRPAARLMSSYQYVLFLDNHHSETNIFTTAATHVIISSNISFDMWMLLLGTLIVRVRRLCTYNGIVAVFTRDRR